MQSKFTISAVLVLLIATSYTFWIKPQSVKLTDKKIELESVQTQISTISGQRITIEENSNISELDLKLIQSAIPQGFDQDELIKALKKLAEDNQVNLVNISFNQTFAETSNQIKAAQITLSASGGPGSIKNFLSKLENSNRGFFVKNLGLSNSTVNEVGVSNLNITFEAFFS
jgi:type II secretory pathway component PulM